LGRSYGGARPVVSATAPTYDSRGAAQTNSVWRYEFVHDRLANGRAIRLLVVFNEHTRECLALEVARSTTRQDVIVVLSRLKQFYARPELIHSNRCPELTTGAVTHGCAISS